MSGIELHTTLGDLDVTDATLRVFLRGNWTVTSRIGWPSLPDVGNPAEFRVTRSDGTVDAFTGSVRRRSQIPGTEDISVTVVGGAGKLLDVIPARHHTAGTSTVPAGLVLAGIAEAAGERLAAGVESALDAYPLTRWTRIQGEAWKALDVLAYRLGLGWRVLQNGTLWMGTEAWPAVDATEFAYSGDPRDGAIWFVADGARYVAGTTIDGARVIETCYRLRPGDTTVEARMSLPGDPVHVVPLDAYARSYAATVASQNSSTLTLDLTASDPALGSDLRDIPFKLGIPGTKVTVPAGSIVRVAFESGMPDGMYAGDINVDTSAAKRFSLVDDDVDGCWLLLTPGDQTLSVVPAATPMAIHVTGKVTGPGHKYAFGVPNT